MAKDVVVVIGLFQKSGEGGTKIPKIWFLGHIYFAFYGTEKVQILDLQLKCDLKKTTFSKF